MSTLDDWTAAVAAALDVPTLPDVPAVLELARDVAHGVERPAAPVTAWLAGFAVASGLDASEVAARIRSLLPP